jgi:hypothetical protein
MVACYSEPVSESHQLQMQTKVLKTTLKAVGGSITKRVMALHYNTPL